MSVFEVLPWINFFLFSLFNEKLIFVPLWSKLRVTLFIISAFKIEKKNQATLKQKNRQHLSCVQGRSHFKFVLYLILQLHPVSDDLTIVKAFPLVCLFFIVTINGQHSLKHCVMFLSPSQIINITLYINRHSSKAGTKQCALSIII